LVARLFSIFELVLATFEELRRRDVEPEIDLVAGFVAGLATGVAANAKDASGSRANRTSRRLRIVDSMQMPPL